MYLNILLLPLIIIITITLYGRYLSHKGIYRLIIFMMLELLILSLILLYESVWMEKNVLNIDTYINYGSLLSNLNWIITIDEISSIMITMILSISILVVIYTYDYMINDAHINRFYLYIIIFIFNMLLLITTSNLFILFIGWEGVGLSSFLLISYWFTRIETSLGALLALFMNRIGDIFFIISILFGYLIFGSTDLYIINSYPQFNSDIFILFFFLAAMAKSAQLGLHLWLPYSMEGPTPISALIHAATMVTAGVYIMIRISILIAYSYYSLIFISIIGALTCFIGSCLALTSLDMKELIAYSTMSQLGYMITCLGIKLTNLSFYHLIFHAYFKALLFLTVGSILHTILDIQDLRFTGSLSNFIPISYIFLLVGLTSLIGLPFTTGYYSKESIIMNASNYHSSTYLSLFLSDYIFIITLLTAFITILYSFKFIYNLYFNTSNLSLWIYKHLHFYSLHLTLALSLLSLITLFLGFIFIYSFCPMVYGNIPYIPFINHNISVWIKFIPLSFFFISFFILTSFSFKSNLNFYILNIQFGYKYLYIFIAGQFINLAYRILSKFFDSGFFDIIFPLIGSNLYSISISLSKLLSLSYLLSFILSSLFILLLIFPPYYGLYPLKIEN